MLRYWKEASKPFDLQCFPRELRSKRAEIQGIIRTSTYCLWPLLKLNNIPAFALLLKCTEISYFQAVIHDCVGRCDGWCDIVTAQQSLEVHRC